jgi:hypothetical protein
MSAPSQPRGPVPCIGLRRGVRVSGEHYLYGVVSETLTLEAGARVQLRRLRPDGDHDGPTHAIVFAPCDGMPSGSGSTTGCNRSRTRELPDRTTSG